MEKVFGIAEKALDKVGAGRDLKAELIKAELNSDSKLVKSVRPILTLAGLVVIFLEMFGIRIGLLLFMGANVEIIRNSTALMEFFIVTWSGIVSVYVFGRTREKISRTSTRIKDEIRHERKIKKIKRRRLRKEKELLT